ncbi:MAG TPA: fibronectin type III domain-containing protein [Chitinophagaceae bacterium]|nr:fibronectin type III domain-containing protein [Chitinophagaceae bacterium]
MRPPKTLINFSKLSDSELEQHALAIVTAMTGNANFTTPVPALTVLSDAISSFQEAMSNAATGDRTAVSIKDDQRIDMESILRSLGLYVQIQSGGDTSVMLSSGFKISKTPAPVGPLPKPTGFKITQTGKGEVRMELDKIDGASAYQFEFRQATETQWSLRMSTKTRVIQTELESGKEYIFRVLPIGASDIREYSDEISSFMI